MSTRIVDQFAVVRFSAEALRKHVDYYGFYSDQYLLFELGGDNNLSTYHPKTGREVRSRRWSLAAAGKSYEVMATVTKHAAACEGGMLRFTEDSETLSDRFIRRARAAVAKAPAPEAYHGLEFSVSLEIAISANEAIDTFKQRTIGELTELKAPNVDKVGNRAWSFNVLYDSRDAAIFFAFEHLDQRHFSFKGRGYGLEFSDMKLMDRVSKLAEMRGQRTAA